VNLIQFPQQTAHNLKNIAHSHPHRAFVRYDVFNVDASRFVLSDRPRQLSFIPFRVIPSDLVFKTKPVKFRDYHYAELEHIA